MSEKAEPAAEAPKKKSKGLLIAIVAALVLGGGSFFAVFSGLVPLGGEEVAEEGAGHEGGHAPVDYAHMTPPSYVPLEPLVIPLSAEARSRHLRVTLQLEVRTEAKEAVIAVTPRVLDVLNTFLRAVDEREFENPRAMARLRAQMLRRIRLVAPEDAVQDVLIQEFLLN